MNLYELSGLLGFVGYMGSYTLLQTGRISGEGISYSMMNLFAALFILISLSHSFNLGSALIQTAWISLSVLGICRTLYARMKKQDSRLPGKRSSRRQGQRVRKQRATERPEAGAVHPRARAA